MAQSNGEIEQMIMTRFGMDLTEDWYDSFRYEDRVMLRDWIIADRKQHEQAIYDKLIGEANTYIVLAQGYEVRVEAVPVSVIEKMKEALMAQSNGDAPDELDMFIYTHTSLSADTDDGVYREAEYYALKDALGLLVKQHELDMVNGVLNRLNDKMFYSSSNPDGQYVKDCIFEELDKVATEQKMLRLKGASYDSIEQ